MEDGDLVAPAVVVPHKAGPGAPAVAVPRSATPVDAGEASVVESDARSAGSSSASDRRAAIVDLMHAHGDAVLGLCIRVLRDRELAEEVRQQTFLEAFRDFDRFQGRSSRRAWLFGIANHRCLDVIKKWRSVWIESDDDALINRHDPGSGPSEQLEQAQLTAALEECMKSLSPEMRMTVLMRFQTELTYEELAVQLSATADALQVRVTRALSRLRRCLESKGVYDV
jgi:RNA polymerase sigma-70 factor (ECF subfamily)